MIRRIEVRPSRSLVFHGRNFFGIQGEKNAEILKFCLPEKINDVDYSYDDTESINWIVVLINSSSGYGEYILDPEKLEFPIPVEYTYDEEATLMVMLRDSDDTIIWKSEQITLKFSPEPNVVESNIQKIVIKSEYDTLYDMLDEKDIELPEKKLEPNQSDLDELIQIAKENIGTGGVDELAAALNEIKESYNVETVIDDTDFDTLLQSMNEMYDELGEERENYYDLLTGMEEILGITGGDSDE